MKTKADNYDSHATKHTFPKKPTYYFHADEDFREDREWGRDKSADLSQVKPAMSRMTNNVTVQ